MLWCMTLTPFFCQWVILRDFLENFDFEKKLFDFRKCHFLKISNFNFQRTQFSNIFRIFENVKIEIVENFVLGMFSNCVCGFNFLKMSVLIFRIELMKTALSQNV